MRDLHGDLSHTDTVNRLMSEFAVEARTLDRYHLSELDPPERALLRPNHDPKTTGIYPDAGGSIRYVPDAGTRWISFVLEVERRAIDADRAAAKVKLYQNFFASGHTWSPSDRPLCLFVFDTSAEEDRFFGAAKKLDSDVPREVRVPFGLSHLEQIKATGFLGPTWLVPEAGGEAERANLRQLNADLRRS